MFAVMVTINEMYAKTLSKWASVSRTLRTAESGCADVGNCVEISSSDADKYKWCATELNTLTPALDNLHQSVRGKLWQLQDEKTQFFGVYLMANDSEEAMPVAIGMVPYFENFASKCDLIFDKGKFCTEVLTKDRFMYLCQEGKTPVFP